MSKPTTARGSKAPPRAWQRMLSGRALDLLDPPRSTSKSMTLRTALRASRAGTGRRKAVHIFSVAQHSCSSKRWRAPRFRGSINKGRLAILLHDAPEYVIGDMISPFKAVIGDSYKAVEKRLLAAIHLRFGLPAKLPEPLQALIKASTEARVSRGDAAGGFAEAEARKFFGPPRNFRAALERDYLKPWPAGPRRPATASASKSCSAAEPFHDAAQAYNKAEESHERSMIHVCSLSRLHATVDETGAQHIVTLLRLVDSVQRPSHIAPQNHLVLSVDDITMPMDGYTLPAQRARGSG
jgi:5'-deoxynucleotidase YfbR-like HD superfamily hydrolase